MEKFNSLIGHNYYMNEFPIGIITYIRYEGNNYYRVFLNSTHYNYLDVSKDKLIRLSNELIIRDERKEFLIERKIKRLVHFTSINNLDSILEHGLLSVNLLKSNNMNYICSDEYRMDCKLDYICNSISFPNYKMFYSKRMNTNYEWIILTINSNILLHKLSAEFYKSNAASNDYSLNRDYTGNGSLMSMFYNEDRETNLPSNYTTNPQAEALIKDNITKSYITSVETIRENPKVRSLALNSNIDYINNSQYFKPRIDYRRW